MRLARFRLLFGILILNLSIWAQAQTPVAQNEATAPQQPQPVTASSPTVKDAQAVNLITQVLSLAGGATAIMTIADYTGTGTITYHEATDVQGGLTVRGSGLDNLRIDATLPTGIRSEAISYGQDTVKTEDGGVTPLQLQAPISPSRLVLPYLLLAPALNSSAFSFSYKGIVDLNGSPAHDVQIVRILPGVSDPTGLMDEFSTIDFFIDPVTSQLLMMQDVVLNHMVRQIQYSDYRLANGILIPFSITEQLAGQPVWQMNLNQITFNAGLQDSDFQL